MTIDNHEEGSVPSSESINSDDLTAEEQDLDPEDREIKEDSRFKEGQILRFVRVRFPGNSRSFPFLVGKRQVDYGQKVVAMSDRGLAVGYVNSFPYDVPFNKSMLPVRSISKIATNDDISRDMEAYHQQKNAEHICNEMIEQHKLDMHLTHVEFTSFGKKAIFYFTAPSRIDFRDLVRDLVHKLRTRIELRQISVRDRSASIGGIGPCGRELCCSSFLTKYGNVGIKMAKNQDLTLNFSKLNGVCGQLKCCLQYEEDVYREKRSKLPRENDIITTHTGELVRVDRLHLLSEQFEGLTSRGVRKRYTAELYKESLNKEEANFPKEFDGITDETHKVVGLDESQAAKVKAFETEIRSLKEKSKSFADSIFENLFGAKTLDYSLPEIEEPETAGRRRIVTPDEEEEIQYTPDADELLEEDEEDELQLEEVITTPFGGGQTGEDLMGTGQDREARAFREPRDRDAGRDGRRHGRDQRRDGNRNRGARDGQRSEGQRQPQTQQNRDQQSRGRPDNRPRRDGGGQQNRQQQPRNQGPKPQR